MKRNRILNIAKRRAKRRTRYSVIKIRRTAKQYTRAGQP